MPRRPLPWFDNERSCWKVTIRGKRHNLGDDKNAAFEEFHRLMSQPEERAPVSPQSLPGIVDAFLDWNAKQRAPDTYEWYRYRLQRFVDKYPDIRVQQLRVYHVENWVDDYAGLSRTSRRNYFRSIKRCLKWAVMQGYIESNPLEALEIANLLEPRIASEQRVARFLIGDAPLGDKRVLVGRVKQSVAR